jgi:Fur family transcriptional regulator, ferric uptake regulator
MVVYTYSVKEKTSRNTAAKRKIEEVFQKTTSPITLKQLYKKVATAIPGVAYSTVFRVVERLEKDTIVSRVGFKDRGALYEWSGRPHHHHLVCEKCDDVADISDQMLSFNDSKVAKSTGFVITNHSVELTGICKPCQENN